MSCWRCQDVETLFGKRMAERDLRRFRKSGPARTTRILLDALIAEGVEDATLLDIGGGVGAIPNTLLAAGARSAVAVEASTASRTEKRA
jgi:predicted RNA methylase